MYPWKEKELLDALKGETIEKIAINEKKNRLYIADGQDRIHAFFTDGDCCSKSWVENIEFQGTVLGRKIHAVSAEDEGKVFKAVDEVKEGFDDYSQLLDYSTTFHTEGGSLKIEYRNESNGYYGGQLDYEGTVEAFPDNVKFIVGDM